jgi:hypothetical protein
MGFEDGVEILIIIVGQPEHSQRARKATWKMEGRVMSQGSILVTKHYDAWM